MLCAWEECEGNVPGHSKRARTCLACRKETDMAAASIFDEESSITLRKKEAPIVNIIYTLLVCLKEKLPKNGYK